MRIEAVFVELIKVSRVEDGHIDVAGAEQVIDQRLVAIAAKFLEGPHCLGRTEGAVISEKAPDPALPVFIFPVFGVGIPAMHMAVDHEDVATLIMVHLSVSSCSCPDVAVSPRTRRVNKARQKEPLASSATRIVREAS